MPVRFLIPKTKYLAAGVYVGLKQKTEGMKEFIYTIRPDGLALFNLKKVDERVRIVAKFLARYERVIVTTRKIVAFQALKKFFELTNYSIVLERFMPGMLTNPSYAGYKECDVLFVVDPLTDYRAIEEGVKAHIPIVAICNTSNETRNIDLILPANNVGKKALATIFWLLTREILKIRGEIKSDREFKVSIEEFEPSGK
jgi:small subunit ribosomal protein S2